MKPSRIRAPLGIAIALWATSAVADRRDNPDYPQSFVERPLTLPQLMFAPTVGVGFTNIANGGTGETLSLGLDVGVAPRVQVGVFFAFPIHPNPDFGTFLGNLQVRLSDIANVRIDLGVERQVYNIQLFGLFGSDSSSGFVAGLGLPFKYKVNPMFAVVSGSTAASGFGTPILITGPKGLSSVYGATFEQTIRDRIAAHQA